MDKGKATEQMDKQMNGQDYLVCNHCRIKKIRCGREKPSCANCTRLSLKCEWSGQGKKCNQTALLTQTIIGLSSRLENLESSVLDTRNSLKRLFEESATSSTAPTISLTKHAKPTLEVPVIQSPDMTTDATYTRPLGRLVRDEKSGRSKRYFGPTSLASLMLDIKDIIVGSFEAEFHGLGGHIQEAHDKIDLLLTQGGRGFLSDKTYPTPPPFAILDAMIEPYFTRHNPHFPIWRKASFIGMADKLRQSAFPEREYASIVCCNSLVLITLAANSSGCRNRPNNTRQRSSIDSDFLRGFLANAKRAIENVELLLSPCLLNLKALLSLCVVAQENLSSENFQSLFALASQCAKSIGLDQWHCFEDKLEEEDASERRNLVHCLYILDKTIFATSGLSPSITKSYIHIESPTISIDDSTTIPPVARVRLAAIQETIYFEIYACRVVSKTEDQVYQQATEILLQLQHWVATMGVDLGDVDSEVDISAWKVEVAIHFYCAQLLLIWPYKGHPNVMFQQRTDISRRCMRLLMRLWNSDSTDALPLPLPRILASHPPLYLHELFTKILDGTENEPDMDLLRGFSDMLQTITNSREEGSFNDKLCELSLILVHVMEASKSKAQSTSKRRRTLSDDQQPTSSRVRLPTPGGRSQVSTPSTTYLSSSYDISSMKSPLPVSLEPQYLDGFDFANWDDSFGLLTPTTSGFSESAGDQVNKPKDISKCFGKGLLELFHIDNISPRIAGHPASHEPW